MEFGTSPSVRLPPTLNLVSTILVQFVTQQFAPKVKVVPKAKGKKSAEKYIYEGHFTPAGAQVLAPN